MGKIGFLLTTIVLVFVSSATAQIPNAGFETWVSGSPDSWYANNVPALYTTIVASTTAHSGTYSARGDVVSVASTIIQPVLQSGTSAEGFAYAQRPAAFTGYYQFFPAASSGDRFAINVVLFKGGVGGTSVAVAASAPSSSISSFTQFTVPFVYLTADVPDTCVVQIQIVGPGTGAQATPHLGSYFLLDDIGLSGATGIADKHAAQPLTFELNQNYPNPFNPSTTISFSLAEKGRAVLRIFNVLGQQVAVLFDQEADAGKVYRATFNGSSVPSGFYFAKLESGGRQMTAKMTLLK